MSRTSTRLKKNTNVCVLTQPESSSDRTEVCMSPVTPSCFHLDPPTHLQLILQPHPWWLLLLHMDWFSGSDPSAVSECFYCRAFIYCLHSIRVTSGFGFHNKMKGLYSTQFHFSFVAVVTQLSEAPVITVEVSASGRSPTSGAETSKLVWYDTTIKVPSWDDKHKYHSIGDQKQGRNLNL